MPRSVSRNSTRPTRFFLILSGAVSATLRDGLGHRVPVAWCAGRGWAVRDVRRRERAILINGRYVVPDRLCGKLFDFPDEKRVGRNNKRTNKFIVTRKAKKR